MDGCHYASPRRLLRRPANELVRRALEGSRVTGLRHDIIPPPQLLIFLLLSSLTALRFFFRVKSERFPRVALLHCHYYVSQSLRMAFFFFQTNTPAFWWKTAFRASLSGLGENNGAFGKTNRLQHWGEDRGSSRSEGELTIKIIIDTKGKTFVRLIY